jgi:hypothetical protein
MYIPAFIEDDEIVDKLNEKGIRKGWDVHERYNCIVGKNQRTIIILTVDFNSIQ